MMVNYRDMTRNVMAREKALYEGHAIAAVAAINEAVAAQALKLIEVEYEVLPHVLDVAKAMEPDAPLLHEEMYTIGVEPRPAKPSNIAKRVEFALGDVAAGFAKADVVVEREFDTKPVHQGYIEPHACLASVSEDGQAELWCTTQGQFIVRSFCAKLLGMELSKLRVTASEIGGGFGGKTVVYLEPLALALSRKAGQPVKMVMSRTGGVPGDRPDLRREDVGQDRRDPRRPDHGGRGAAQVPGGRIPGIAGAARMHVRVRSVRPREREGGRLRRRGEPAEGRRLPRAGRTDRGVRRRVSHRRDRQAAGARPDRVPAEERGEGGHQGRVWTEVRSHRPGADAGGGARASELPRAAEGRTRAAAWLPGSGSTSAEKPARRSTSPRTAP